MPRDMNWILRLRGDDLIVAAGPFPTEEELEAGMIATLQQDGYEPLDKYYLAERAEDDLEVDEAPDGWFDWLWGKAFDCEVISEEDPNDDTQDIITTQTP